MKLFRYKNFIKESKKLKDIKLIFKNVCIRGKS